MGFLVLCMAQHTVLTESAATIIFFTIKENLLVRAVIYFLMLEEKQRNMQPGGADIS